MPKVKLKSTETANAAEKIKRWLLINEDAFALVILHLEKGKKNLESIEWGLNAWDLLIKIGAHNKLQLELEIPEEFEYLICMDLPVNFGSETPIHEFYEYLLPLNEMRRKTPK